MKQKLRRLASRQIYIGTSSWKYTGWKGLVFAREYRSEKAFNETCFVFVNNRAEGSAPLTIAAILDLLEGDL